MNNKFMKLLLACLFFGVVLTIGSRTGDILFLSGVFFVPLLLILPKFSPAGAFFAGLSYGLVGNACLMYWIYPMNYHATGSHAASFIFLLLYSAYLALYYGIWAFAVRIIKLPSLLKILFASSLWVALEYFHLYYLSGIPWPIVGVWQWKTLWAIQICDITGIFGVSFLILLMNTGLVEFYRTRRWQILALIFGALAISAVYGVSRLQMYGQPEKGNFRVAVIQGSIDQYKKWDKRFEEEIKETYSKLAREAALLSPDLIIWPETSIPGTIPSGKEIMTWIESTVKETKTYNLLGSPFSAGNEVFHNASVLFDADAKMLDKHYKMYLVPGAEYIPMRSVLWPYIGVYNAIADFTPGKTYDVFSIKGVKFGPSICHENFFGDTIRRITKNGAEFITNQTNDGWFLGTYGHQEHFMFNVFRAIENRRTVIVSDNTGVSGVLSPAGKISDVQPLFVNTVFITSVAQRNELTFYTKYGDIFAKLCIVISMIFIVLFFVSKRNNKSHGL